MPEMQMTNSVVTQVTTVKTDPKNQSEALKLMKERARFMATQPGFVSITLHRSADNSHILNYVQWASREQLKAAHDAPEFRDKWPRFGELVQEAEPCLYEVVLVQDQKAEKAIT
jgi:quinol monooxygenase YgiN